MKTLALALAGAVVGIGFAFGETYVWQGADGDWNTAANWSPNGVPGAGDLAVFESGAEITSEIVIGEGTLSVSNVTDAAIHFKGEISGAGGFSKFGDGAIHLHCQNTFAGKFTARGINAPVTTENNARASSPVYVYASDPFGTQAAELDKDADYGHGARLYLMGDQTDTIEISVPLNVTGDQTSNGNVFIKGNCTTVTFKGLVTSGCRINVTCDKYSTVTFGAGYTAGNYHFFKNGDFHFKGPINGTFYPGNNTCKIFLYGSDLNTSGTFYFGCPVIAMATNVLNTGTHTFQFSSAKGVVDLNGYDQLMTIDKNMAQVANATTHGFTSPDGKPAMLHLANAVAAQDFHGCFSGTAGLEWAPADATREFVFSKAIQTTKGEFRVTSGAMRFTDAAGFTQLGKLTVAAGAAVAAEATAGDLVVTAVEIAADGTSSATGRVSLSKGVMLKTNALTVGGEPKGYATYSADDLPGVLEGEGLIMVCPPSNEWIGGDGDWNDPANWSQSRAPEKDDDVYINGKVKVTVGASTPALLGLTLTEGATLTFSNWTTCVEANVVRLRGSIATVAAPFTNETNKCRVHFKCATFDMDATSKIDMDGKGWRGGHFNYYGYTDGNPSGVLYNDEGDSAGGYGPGRARCRQSGASHLGLGASSPECQGLVNGRWKRPRVYDDPYDPIEPGSGGYRAATSAYSSAFHPGDGGGAVLIEATGAVKIDGKILARGVEAYKYWFFNLMEKPPTVSYNPVPDQVSTAGAGGSVNIRCETISGSGEIRADGGDGARSVGPKTWYDKGLNDFGAAGGGGGVAIVCSGEQTAGACAGLTLSAGAGTYFGFVDISNKETGEDRLRYAAMDKYDRGAEPGTVYLTSEKIVDDTIGKGLCGRLMGFTEYTYDGDLDWTWGHVRFAETGVTFRVTGDLSVAGEWSRVDIGGNHSVTNWGSRIYVTAGDEPVTLDVGGNLSVSNDAALFVYAAEVPDESAWGAEVKVGGTFAVGGGGAVYPTSDFGKGGAPHFTAASFVLAEDGRIDADGRGCSGGWAGDVISQTYGVHVDGIGLGHGIWTGAGAGHGGIGGIAWDASTGKITSGTKGEDYDDRYVPTQSGSGGSGAGYSVGGSGGGVFHLTCTGPITVNGTITANGLRPLSADGGEALKFLGAGSGGAVYLYGSTLAGGENARILVRGGDGQVNDKRYASGCGAGGRVALRVGGDLETSGEKLSCRHRTTPTDEVFGGRFDWRGPLPDVTGGTNIFLKANTTVFEQNEETWAEDGSLWFCGTIPAPGLLMFVR